MNTIKIRNILFLSSLAFIGLLVAIPNKIFAAGLLGAFVIAALILYYANIRSLNLHVHSEKSPPYVRVVAVVLAALVVGIIVFAVFVQRGRITASASIGKSLITIIFSTIIILIGFIAAKLPYKAPMGLRLPWTLSDNDTWYVAHRILSDISVPMAILCFAALSVYNRVEVWILCILFAWLFIPSIVSHTYILKKWHGKL